MDYSILYTYIKTAIIDETNYAMDVVDSLKYNQKDFFTAIKDDLALENHSNATINITNLFCICARYEQIEKIKHSISSQILDRITIGNNFEIKYNQPDMYTQYLNIYTHYLLDNHLSPLIFSFEIEDLSFLYMFGSTKYYQEPPEKIRNILNIWYQKEQPILCGKQIITQSFYYQSLVGRKVLNIVSSQNDDNLYLLLEGNIKVKLDYSSISSYNYIDTDNFKSTDIQKILYNPIYCFGYMFEPETIFFDWFDIYLYAMALLDVNLENTQKLKSSYLAFLNFIEQHICEKIYADEAFFNQDYFFDILKIHIENINQFMKR